jgi:hypothetical protein
LNQNKLELQIGKGERKMKKILTIIIIGLLCFSMFLTMGVPPAKATVETGWPVSQPNTPRNADDIFIDFESGIEGIEIESTNPNLKFTTTSGLNWRYGDIRTGSYNVYPYGSKAYECRGNFFAWLGVTGNAGRIDFLGGAATYCSVLVSTYSGLVIDAYNSDSELISTSGWAGSNINTRTFTRLTVDAPAGDYISYVIFHDTGNYWLIDDLCTDAKPAVIPVPGRSIGDHSDRFDIVFVPDTDYGSPQDIDTWLPTFIDHINHQIDDRLGGAAPVSGHLDEFNFYYTRMQGIASSLTLPEDLTKISTFADVYVMFHTTPFGDQTVGRVYSAEGSLTDSEHGRSFIHESGHGIFGVADEYDDTTPPYTNYFQANPYPNIWETRAVGRTDAAGEYAVPIHDEILGDGDGTKVQFGPIANGNSPNAANTFFADTDIDGDVDTSDVRVYLDGIRQETSTYGINPGTGIVSFSSAPPAGASVTIDYSYVKDEDWNPIQVQRFTVVQGDWWKLGTTPYIMEDGSHFANGWGKPGARRIQWFLDQYPDGSATAAASPQTEKSIWLNLELSTEGFHLIDDSYIIESPPDYLPGTYDFTAKVFSTSGELLGEYGFGDPRRVMAELGYDGPTWLDSANFQLILQYFNRGGRVDLIESATGSVELSVDISKYVTAPTLDPSSLTYTGITSGQYSDPIALSATLKDLTTNSPLSGKTVTFTIGTQTATGTTNTSGVATASVNLNQASGAYTVTASFAGDSSYLSSSDSKPFAIDRENVAITYTGDTLVFTAGPTTSTAPVHLAAHLVQESDGYPGDLTLAGVTFALFKSSNLGSTPDLTYDASVDSAGNALYDIASFAADVWTVRVTMKSGNLYWTQTSEGLGILVVSLPGLSATGGGWIPDSGSANGKDNFGFTVQYNRNVGPKGNFVFVLRGKDGYDYVAKSNSWQGGGLSFMGTNNVYFSGKCNVQKIDRTTGAVAASWGNYKFAVDITDGDLTIPHTTDTIAIRIVNSINAIWRQIGTPTAQIPLGGGNIVIHSK